MSKINRSAYERLISGDIEALEDYMPDTLERRHIIAVLLDSIISNYPTTQSDPYCIKDMD